MYDNCIKVMDAIQKPLDIALFVIFAVGILFALLSEEPWGAKVVILLFPIGIAIMFAGVRSIYVAGIVMQLKRCDEDTKAAFGHYHDGPDGRGR